MKFESNTSIAPHFREQMRLDWTDSDQRRFENLFVFVGFVNRFVPRFIRHGGSHALMADIRRTVRKDKGLI